jgi:hypothetical protein
MVMLCESHQRPWRDLCVDCGLENEWLESLNSLIYWKPFSTCEGHPDRTGGGAEDHPRVWLLLDESHLDRLARIWSTHARTIQRLRQDCFPNVHTISRLGFEQNKPICGTNCALHLDCRIKRKTVAMAPEIAIWWRGTIKELQRFDKEFGSLLAHEA